MLPKRVYLKHTFLRVFEPSDIELLYRWPYTIDKWEISSTKIHYPMDTIERTLAAARQQDIYTTKQLRLIIAISSNPLINIEDRRIGCIDLFDFDPNHQRAGIGILIADKRHRRKKYAKEALKLSIDYCFSKLNLRQLYCNITSDNESSILLFQQQGFEITGKKQRVCSGSELKDELLLQLVRK